MQRIKLISDRRFQVAAIICVGFFVYFMGGILIVGEHTRESALHKTPYALLAGIAVMAFFDRSGITPRQIAVLAFIALSGYIIEVIGVKTGLIFGHYSYGPNFGLKLFSTPLLIGINWLFLVYSSAASVGPLKVSVAYKPLLAALLMLVYDLVMEEAAPKMGLWHWASGSYPPLGNFTAWLLIALFYQWILKRFSITPRNIMAAPLLFIQLLLFIAVILYVH